MFTNITALENYLDNVLSEDSDVLDSSIYALESAIDTCLEDLGEDEVTAISLEAIIELSLLALESELGEGPVEELLTKAKAILTEKTPTVEDVDVFLEKMETESAKYNNALGEMKLAGEEFQTEQIDKETFKARIKPYITELEESCKALGLDDVEDNVSNLKAFIVGIHQFLTMRREELSRCDGGDTPSDDEDDESMVEVEDVLESFFVGIDSLEIKSFDDEDGVIIIE